MSCRGFVNDLSRMSSESCPGNPELRARLLKELLAYRATDRADDFNAKRIIEIVQSEPRCAFRDCYPAHVTSSAFVISEERDEVLLLHHAKLGIWVQPGGHADGDFDLSRVACREVAEETGLTSARLATGCIFDVDIHVIPARGPEPQHEHLDIRYLFIARRRESLRGNDESHDMQWIQLAQIKRLTNERSILRMREKLIAGDARTA